MTAVDLTQGQRRGRPRAKDNALCLTKGDKVKKRLRSRDRGIPPPVTSPQFTNAAKLARTVSRLGLEACWPSLVPRHYGVHRAVEAAALAVIYAAEYRMQDPSVRDDQLLKANAFRSYGKAITLLKQSLHSHEDRLSDSTILTIGLLSMHDFLTQYTAGRASAMSSTHFAAIQNILLLRPHTQQHSDVTRAMVSRMWLQWFYLPMVTNEVSPFDDPQWLDIDPVRVWTLPSSIAQLHKISYQLFVRLPRLIRGVRAIREGSDFGNLGATVELARTLVNICDDRAESELLHRLKVKPTKDLTCQHLVPFSFEFANLDEMRAALNYWQTRLIVFRLCLVLGITQTNAKKIREEQVRLTVNIVMAWDYAFAKNSFDHALAHAAFVVWHALSGSEKFKNLPIEEAKFRIMQCLDRSLVFWKTRPSPQELDRIVGSLAGGPIVEPQDHGIYATHCSVPEMSHQLKFTPEEEGPDAKPLDAVSEALDAKQRILRSNNPSPGSSVSAYVSPYPTSNDSDGQG